MDFTFTEDQLLFQESVRDFLQNEVTCERIRALESIGRVGPDRYDGARRARWAGHD